ncbi:S26 family signal peptidase [Parvularcula flava]|uniref:Peptidase S26 n=1 Tax=Aquisalinus luteolus TaxID=1566827 RepID=A0A8J3A0Z4_9PROT|nr:S26 family signal peptidase [Aquisalinus luteolus]NHK27152.1 S26 family signal peptidase [Aquisalinus luteolus]GGH94557.1 peptidase S26 [Aquisalinus luteolus]
MGLDRRTAQMMRGRIRVLAASIAGAGLGLFGLVFAPAEPLIWNRTGSAPAGLYRLTHAPLAHGEWVVVAADSAEARWAAAHGFVGRDWPLIKQIAGMQGDEICRLGTDISINGKTAGAARLVDSRGRKLPVWEGCVVLGPEQLFLMSPHPDSLDGRYFGPVDRRDIAGVARLVVEWE